MLAGIWSRVLKISAVSVHDNFFAIGGHSLLATQVNSRLRDTFKVELPLRNIFEYPTIAGFAEKIETALAANAESQIPPLSPAPRDQDLPLSFAQERLWFLDQLTPGGASYNIAEAYKLSGPLNPEALEQSLNEVVRRHEVLRTTFAIPSGTKDARPVQVIAPELRLSLPVVDLSGSSEAERKDDVERFAAEEARRPFDLARGPLLRATLLRLGAEEHVVLLTVHHIVSDDWSTFVYLREIAILYDAFIEGRPSLLPELPIQYADYACWQRQSLQGEILESQRAYWKQRLAGAPPSLELPASRPRPAIQSSRGASQSFVLTEELSAALAGLSRQEGSTLFMTLLAAFQTLLYRYTGQDDITVGSPVSNRNRSELEGLIGFFVNTLALRTDLSGVPNFRELLRRVRETALGAYAHQDMPFEKLVQELQPNRDLSRTPIFQVMLVMQNIPGQAPELARQGLNMRSMKARGGVAKFDLTLFVTESGGKLSGALNYNTDLFDDDAIVRMLDHFRNLLEAIAANPDRSVAALPMLSEAEERQTLAEWSGSRDEAPLDQCLHQLFEAQVERTPDAIAVTFEDECLSYRELNRRANQTAHYLRKLGVGPEVLVGVCLDRSIGMMVGLLGVLKAGGAYVPLDPNYPADRLAFMLKDARAQALLTQKHLMGLLLSQSARLCCLDDEWSEIAQESDENLESLVAAENLAYVIYTSGSTGKPKGSLITHRGLTNYLNWCLSAYPVADGRGSVVHSTIAFDATITALFAPLLAGRAVRLLPERIALDALAETLRQEGDYSLIKITPAHLDLLSHQLSPEEAGKLTRAFVIGGENLLKEQIRFWQEHAGETHLFNEYGPTEAVVGCVVHDAAPDQLGIGSVSIGRPIPNTQVFALDQFLQPVPVGARGELYLGGVGLARGYLDRPELTAEKFIPHPFSEIAGERLYRTGDVVRFLPDGKLEFLGRVDEQVKIRGYRIECGEIESLLGQREGVREAVVIAREDIPGDKRLVAYCVAQLPGKLPAHVELRNFLKEQLPEYMIPSFFVELEAMPLTLNGKVDRRALPAPDKTRPELKAEFVAPRTPAEERLAAICAEVLGLERVGVHDHFFDLGGHSLLATQVVSRVRQAFEIELPLRSLFETPTVAGLAENIETILWAAQSLQAPPTAEADDREEGEI
ncbi:MAG: amino acid adenylation domain-containing protein [Blastocatellales bacterium]